MRMMDKLARSLPSVATPPLFPSFVVDTVGSDLPRTTNTRPRSHATPRRTSAFQTSAMFDFLRLTPSREKSKSHSSLSDFFTRTSGQGAVAGRQDKGERSRSSTGGKRAKQQSHTPYLQIADKMGKSNKFDCTNRRSEGVDLADPSATQRSGSLRRPRRTPRARLARLARSARVASPAAITRSLESTPSTLLRPAKHSPTMVLPLWWKACTLP